MQSTVSPPASEGQYSRERFVDQIEQAHRSRHCLKLHAGGSTVVLDFANELWIDPDRILPGLLQHGLDGGLPLIEDVPARTVRDQLAVHGRPLAEFWWELVYNCFDAGSAARFNLRYGCRRDDVVHLSRWPNFSRVTVNPAALRMAALFSARPTSVFLASKILEVPMLEVERFYAASVASGFVERVNRQAQAEPQAPRAHRQQGLIKSLMNHLSRAYSARSA